MEYPPVGYVIFEDEQPSKRAWQELFQLMKSWNDQHICQFLYDETVLGWNITFEEGLIDPEFEKLQQLLLELKDKENIVWFAGITREKEDEELETCAYLDFIGDGYPDEFYGKESSYLIEAVPCDICGNTNPYTPKIIGDLVIDESYLDSDNPTNREYGGHPDLINIGGGAMMISKAFKQVLEEVNTRGLELIPVISKQTGKETDRLFIIRAKKAVWDPCHEHTPRIENAICATCGSHNDSVFGYFTVPKHELEEVDLVSKNPYGYSQIYFAKHVADALRNSSLKGLILDSGIDTCEH